MKKILLLITTLMFTTNVYAEELQLTDYVYTNAKRMLDGYSYVSYGDKYNYGTRKYGETESNILKPNGEVLYTPNDFQTEYVIDKEPLPNEFKFAYNLPANSFPQGISGKDFIVKEDYRQYSPKTDDYRGAYTALMNSDGKLLTKLSYSTYNCISDNYYIFYRNQNTYFGNQYIPSDEFGIVNKTTGKEFALNGLYYYYSPNTDKIAVIYKNDGIISKDDRCVIVLYNGEEEVDICNTKMSESDFYYNEKTDGYNKFYRTEFNLTYNGELYQYIKTNNYKTKDTYDSYVNMNYETGESASERLDTNYYFKKKTINNTDYYALFINLNNTELKDSYAPTGQPTTKYAEYIDKMAEDGLLYNNERCFYKQGITKLDFGIVLGRAYCKAIGYNIDNFTTDTQFADVNNPYCLLLADTDILNSETQFYVNDKRISKETVSKALDMVADKCGVLSEWNGIKIIKPIDTPCPRELAYTETFKLYDLIMQHNDTNYVKFQPAFIPDSDSEAEELNYDKVPYKGVIVSHDSANKLVAEETTNEPTAKTENLLTAVNALPYAQLFIKIASNLLSN